MSRPTMTWQEKLRYEGPLVPCPAAGRPGRGVPARGPASRGPGSAGTFSSLSGCCQCHELVDNRTKEALLWQVAAPVA